MPALADALAARLPADRFLAWDDLPGDRRDRYARALAPDAEPPAGAAFPETLEELSATVAAAREAGWPLLPCGSGTKLGWGAPTRGGKLVLGCDRLNRLVDHAAGDLTVTAEAGMKLADLQAILRETGQFLAVDPTFPEAATLGGLVATADAGSLRQRYGGVRDMLLGIAFARQDGAIARAGGRVVKNVAGYDLMKLHTGAYGTLGAIAQVTFRTYPLPQASQTVVLAGPGEAADRAARSLLNSTLTPIALDFVALPVPEGDLPSPWRDGNLALGGRFAGAEPAVAEQVRRMTDLGESLDLSVSVLAADRELPWWQGLQAARSPAGPDDLTVKFGALPVAAAEAIARLRAAFPAAAVQVHAGSGLGRARLPLPDLAGAGGTEAIAAIADLRAFCESQGGFLTLLDGPIAVKTALEPWGLAGNAIAVMGKIKQQFDCESLFAPGRFPF